MNTSNLFNINVTICEYMDYIERSVELKSGYTCFLNSHMIYEYHTSTQFSKVLDNASFTVADGMPALYSLNFFNGTFQQRIAGNDVIFSLIDKAQKENLRIFLVGSTSEVLKRISDNLHFKGIVHKSYSPPFLPIDKYDFDFQSNLINYFGADIVLVGLGCPKQETWMYMMRNRINASMYGLGGAFLLYAGIDTRAPKWMRDYSLEWVYRLSIEPGRLFKRYFITNLYFIFLFLKKLFNYKTTDT